jgi:hypothetical protein
MLLTRRKAKYLWKKPKEVRYKSRLFRFTNTFIGRQSKGAMTFLLNKMMKAQSESGSAGSESKGLWSAVRKTIETPSMNRRQQNDESPSQRASSGLGQGDASDPSTPRKPQRSFNTRYRNKGSTDEQGKVKNQYALYGDNEDTGDGPRQSNRREETATSIYSIWPEERKPTINVKSPEADSGEEGSLKSTKEEEGGQVEDIEEFGVPVAEELSLSSTRRTSRRGRGRLTDDDSSNENRKREKFDKLLPEEEAVLFENYDVKQIAGMELKDDNFDDIDQFLADAYMGSLKSRDHTYMAILDTPEAHRVHLPTPRRLRDMIQTKIADIPKEVIHPYARELAERSWEVMKKLIIFTLFLYIFNNLVI